MILGLSDFRFQGFAFSDFRGVALTRLGFGGLFSPDLALHFGSCFRF